jgi:prepilin-type N-terminal cleavage/methylation domain-containing protein
MKDILDLRTRSRGFTLVELLVVIAIIGILATLVLLQLGTARARARDTQRITQISQIRTAIEQYYEDNGGHYPTATTLAELETGGYIQQLPADPLDEGAYGYAVDDATGSFHIWACLENDAAALNSDLDLNSLNFDTIVGENHISEETTELCSKHDGENFANCDCFYDLGVNNLNP